MTDALQLIDIHISFKESNESLLTIPYLAINKGENVTIMGASGCGKSTLLSYICGVLPSAFIASGDVIIKGRNVISLPCEARKCGMLFQENLLFPHMTVYENLNFSLANEVRGEGRCNHIENILKDADMLDHIDANIQTLSGGQAARISVLRTLLSYPDILLLDEPFSSLDANLRTNFREFVKNHAKKHHISILLVTHDDEDAKAMGHNIIDIGQ